MIKVYMSHSVGCAGWDIPKMFTNPRFRMGCRTFRWKQFEEDNPREVKMLDWDYRMYLKNMPKTKERHLQLVKDHDFEVVMSMDLWSSNWQECLEYTDELKKYCDRVLIPVHYFVEELLDYELALPNANWFGSNCFPPGEYRNKVTHILGGSPHSQIKLITSKQIDLENNGHALKNIQSIDGNQIFNVAIKAGKYWQNKKPYWCKPKHKMFNDDIFALSLQNLDAALEAL